MVEMEIWRYIVSTLLFIFSGVLLGIPIGHWVTVKSVRKGKEES